MVVVVVVAAVVADKHMLDMDMTSANSNAHTMVARILAVVVVIVVARPPSNYL